MTDNQHLPINTAGNVSTLSDTFRPEISRVAIKPPTFVKSEPDLFFIQIEAQFTNAAISVDFTKYNHVIASLDPQYLSVVSDLIRNPPAENKYTTLKDRLIKEFTASDNKKLRVLLNEIELGDDKPSQLLRKMRELAGTSLSDDALKSLWIDRLPESVRAVVAISNDDINTCAILADKIVEITAPKQQVYEVKASTSNDNSTLSKLTAQIEELSKSVQQLQTNRGRSSNKPNSNTNNNRSRSKSGQNRPYCRFHYKFGAMAKKCEQPCIYKKPEQQTAEN